MKKNKQKNKKTFIIPAFVICQKVDKIYQKLKHSNEIPDYLWKFWE